MARACNADDAIKPFKLVIRALKESTNLATGSGGSTPTEVKIYVETYLCPPMDNDLCLMIYVKEALKRTVALGYARVSCGRYQFLIQPDKLPPPPCNCPRPLRLQPADCKAPCPPCNKPCPPFCPKPKPKPCPPPACPRPCPSCPKKCPGATLGLQGGTGFKSRLRSAKPSKYLRHDESFDSFRKARST